MLHDIFEKAKLWDRMGSVTTGQGWAEWFTIEGHKGNFLWDGNILYLDFGCGDTNVYVHQNSSDSVCKKRFNFALCKLCLSKFDFKSKDKEKTSEIPREKRLFSNKQDSGIFSVLKENNCLPGILYSAEQGQR